MRARPLRQVLLLRCEVYVSERMTVPEIYEQGYEFGFIDGFRTACEQIKACVAMGEWCALKGTLIVSRSYWTSELDGHRYYDCFCPICGVQLKKRDAGVHEGTDLEYCGACRSSW
jgi:hypothetical protein